MADAQVRTTKQHDYTNTKMAQYLARQIESLSGIKSQREIAHDLNYTRPNIISMFKTGEAKVPLEKIPQLAKSLGVDLSLLMRLGLEQYWPGDLKVLNEMFSRVVTVNEMALIERLRAATNDRDPKLPEELLITVVNAGRKIK